VGQEKPVEEFEALVEKTPTSLRPSVKDPVVDFVTKSIEDGNDFKTSLEEAASLNPNDLTSPDSEIKMLYAVLRAYLVKCEEYDSTLNIFIKKYEKYIEKIDSGTMEDEELDGIKKSLVLAKQLHLTKKNSYLTSISNMVSDIAELKVKKAKIESSIKPDAKILVNFVIQIFEIINQMIPKNKAQQILIEIHEKLIVPGVIGGNLSGNVSKQEFVEISEV